MSNKQNFVSSVVKHVQTLVPLQSIVDKLNINVKKQVKTQVNREDFAPIVFIPVEDLVVDKKYQRYIKDYLACIKSVDDNIGRVLDYLEKSGIDRVH